MEAIISLLNTYIIPLLSACWHMMVEMAPYMFLGFIMAGVLHIFVNPRLIFRYLGRCFYWLVRPPTPPPYRWFMDCLKSGLP